MNKGYPLNDPNYNWERRIRGISGDSLINTANSMSDEQKSAFRKAVDAGEPCAYIHTHYDDDEGEDVSTYDYDEIVSAVRNGVPVIWHYGDVGYDTFYMPSKQEYDDSDGSVYIHFLELVDANATYFATFLDFLITISPQDGINISSENVVVEKLTQQHFFVISDSISEVALQAKSYNVINTTLTSSHTLKVTLTSVPGVQFLWYSLFFKTGITVPNITWPNTINWQGGSAPTLNHDCMYEFKVVNNCATLLEFPLV